jgi:hypothetical protein
MPKANGALRIPGSNSAGAVQRIRSISGIRKYGLHRTRLRAYVIHRRDSARIRMDRIYSHKHVPFFNNFTHISVEIVASIIRMKRIRELGRALPVITSATFFIFIAVNTSNLKFVFIYQIATRLGFQRPS